jgi:arylsulfatase A-like enzyme
VNYWDVHHPYEGVEPYIEDVQSSRPAPDWPDKDAIKEHEQATGFRTAALWPNGKWVESNYHQKGAYEERPYPTEITSREDVEYLIDGYDASIRKVDTYIARILTTLERNGIRDETAIIITADHGDALGEHGIYTEHAFPHPPCQQVPMIVSWPGVTESTDSRRIESQIIQFDLIPTICELQGISVPEAWDAESFRSALMGESFSGRDVVVTGHGILTFGRAVYKDEWVYIRLLHPGIQSYPGLYNDPEMPESGLELLHNREEDPHMMTNLIGKNETRAQKMRHRLDSWITDSLATTDSCGRDPLAEMATTRGPYLYSDPETVAEVYEKLGKSDDQVRRIRRSIEQFAR